MFALKLTSPVGIVITALNIAIQASVQPRYAADATALYTFMRSLGMALGVGLGGTIFQNRLFHHLSSAGLPTRISQEAEAFVEILKVLQRTDDVFLNQVLEAFVQAFRNVFEVSAAVAGAGLLLSLLLRHSDLDKALHTKHVLQSRRTQELQEEKDEEEGAAE